MASFPSHCLGFWPPFPRTLFTCLPDPAGEQLSPSELLENITVLFLLLQPFSHTCAKTSLPLERVWKAQSSSLARCSSSSASCSLFKLKYTLKALLVWVTCHSPAQKVKVDTKATSVARMEQLTASLFAKDCLLTLVKSRLALGSPGWLFVRSFVTMPKMAQYTEKWLLLPPSDHIQSVTLFPDQERGMNGPASLLHSWHWVLLFILTLIWVKKRQPSSSPLTCLEPSGQLMTSTCLFPSPISLYKCNVVERKWWEKIYKVICKWREKIQLTKRWFLPAVALDHAPP